MGQSPAAGSTRLFAWQGGMVKQKSPLPVGETGKARSSRLFGCSAAKTKKLLERARAGPLANRFVLLRGLGSDPSPDMLDH